MRRILMLAGLAGVAAAVARKLKGRRPPMWHTADTGRSSEPEAPLSVVPEQSSAPVTAPEPAHDVAGAAPDEALADSVEEPHIATTPDAPLTETDVPKD